MSSLYNGFAELALYIPIAIALVGGILVYSAGGERKIRVIGSSLFIIALLLLSLSYLLESDRENVERRTKEMVSCVSSADWDRFSTYFHPKAHILDFPDSESITKTVKYNCERIKLRSARMTSGKSAKTDEGWIVSFNVYAEADSFSNIQTQWEADWIRDNDQWVISEIRPLGGFGVTASDLAAWIKSNF